MELDIIKDLAGIKTNDVLRYLMFPAKKTTNFLQLTYFLNDYFADELKAIFGRTQIRIITEKRFIYWAIFMFFNSTYSSLGKMFGRNHDTIINGVRKVHYSDDLSKKYYEILVKYILEFEI